MAQSSRVDYGGRTMTSISALLGQFRQCKRCGIETGPWHNSDGIDIDLCIDCWIEKWKDPGWFELVELVTEAISET